MKEEEADRAISTWRYQCAERSQNQKNNKNKNRLTAPEFVAGIWSEAKDWHWSV